MSMYTSLEERLDRLARHLYFSYHTKHTREDKTVHLYKHTLQNSTVVHFGVDTSSCVPQKSVARTQTRGVCKSHAAACEFWSSRRLFLHLFFFFFFLFFLVVVYVVKAVSKKKTHRHHHNPFGGVVQNVVQKHFREEDFRARRVDAKAGRGLVARFGMILDPLGNVCIHSGGRVCHRRLRRRGRRRRRANGLCCCCCQKHL